MDEEGDALDFVRDFKYLVRIIRFKLYRFWRLANVFHIR